jgi:hypothetical protein
LRTAKEDKERALDFDEDLTIIYFTAPLSINPSLLSVALQLSIQVSPPTTMPEQRRKIDGVAFALTDCSFS